MVKCAKVFFNSLVTTQVKIFDVSFFGKQQLGSLLLLWYGLCHLQ